MDNIQREDATLLHALWLAKLQIRQAQGPSLINRAAYSHGRLVHDELLIRVLLQHTMVKKLKRVEITPKHVGIRQGWLRLCPKRAFDTELSIQCGQREPSLATELES
jgi:hypothetical protein